MIATMPPPLQLCAPRLTTGRRRRRRRRRAAAEGPSCGTHTSRSGETCTSRHLER
eukprot:COSAG01_NODE_3532_length_5963_cov_21.070771_3_plen_55_part_00